MFLTYIRITHVPFSSPNCSLIALYWQLDLKVFMINNDIYTSVYSAQLSTIIIDTLIVAKFFFFIRIYANIVPYSITKTSSWCSYVVLAISFLESYASSPQESSRSAVVKKCMINMNDNHQREYLKKQTIDLDLMYIVTKKYQFFC